MKQIYIWIKTKWIDPVWSKVFAFFIIGSLGFIGALIRSVYQKIKLDEVLQHLLSYLIKTKIEINLLFVIIIILVIILFIIVPFIVSKNKALYFSNFIIFFNPSKLKFRKYIVGKWSFKLDDGQGVEHDFAYINKKYEWYREYEKIFILQNIVFKVKDQTVEWTKIQLPSMEFFSIEKLKIKDENTLTGFDDKGNSLIYDRET